MEPFALLEKFYFTMNPELSSSDWELIKAEHQLIELEKGQQILTVGEVCNFVALVTKGLCRMYHQKEDKEIIFDFYEEGRLVSDYVSFVRQSPGRCQIEALQNTTILSLSFASVNILYDKVPAMYKTVTYSLDVLYLSHFEKYSSVLLDDLETRYKNFLQKRPSVASRIPQYMIASYLGISPEALTRLRRRIGL
jgi:CRP-like cAMP-binding protein